MRSRIEVESAVGEDPEERLAAGEEGLLVCCGRSTRTAMPG